MMRFWLKYLVLILVGGRHDGCIAVSWRPLLRTAHPVENWGMRLTSVGGIGAIVCMLICKDGFKVCTPYFQMLRG